MRGGFFRRSRENKGKTNMKQLKFMLAAAAALGIASAQAALTTNTTGFVNMNFDLIGETDVPNPGVSELSGFLYEGDPEDNESKIVVKSGTDLALSVNTSTNPVLCTVQNGGAPYSLVANKSLYIDTMVQFTVTPDGDVVTNAPTDKLMIYLQEIPAVKDDEGNETVAATTKLMVKAAKHTQVQSGRDTVDNFAACDVAVSAEGITVTAGQWYRLVVTSYVENSITLFTITLDGVPLVADEKMYFSDNSKTIFPSILGKSSQNITYVGFAGEGVVDNIVAAEVFETPDVVSFTFAIDIDDGVNSVVYTIGEGEGATDATISADEAAITVASGTKVTLNKINLKALYVLASDSAKEKDSKTISAAGEKFVVKTTALTGEEGATVPKDKTPADIGISENTGIPADIASTKLDSMIKWAIANKGDGEAIDVINEMAFDQDGNPKVDNDGATTNVAAQAYLLNCAIDDVPVVEKAFKFDTLTFTANGLPDLAGIAKAWGTGDSATLFNGEPVLDYKASLTAPWGEPPASLTESEATTGFFRARLVLDDGINE